MLHKHSDLTLISKTTQLNDRDFPYKNVTQRQLLTHGHITRLYLHNVQRVLMVLTYIRDSVLLVSGMLLKVGFYGHTMSL